MRIRDRLPVWTAVVTSIPLFLAALTLPAYGVWLWARTWSREDHVIALGLDAHTGPIVIAILAFQGLKSSSPLVAYQDDGSCKICIAILVFFWAGVAITNALIVALSNPLGVPGLGTGSGVVFISAVVGWTVFDALISLSPLVLWSPGAEGVRPQARPGPKISHSPASAGPAARGGRARERLLRAMLDTAKTGTSGPARGIEVTADGTLLTSQRALGELAAMSPGSVNRALKELQHERRIAFQASKQETKIKILGLGSTGEGESPDKTWETPR